MKTDIFVNILLGERVSEKKNHPAKIQMYIINKNISNLVHTTRFCNTLKLERMESRIIRSFVDK